MDAITVLLVEPQAIMREGLRAVLESAPNVCVVSAATDVADAVLQVQEYRPDVVVLDLAMLNSAGCDAVRRIRAACPTARVLVLAARDDANSILWALQAGGHGVILHHTTGPALVDAVRAVQTGGTYISGEASDALIRDYLVRRGSVGDIGPLNRLSQRERQVLAMVVDGKTSSQIADLLAISPKSVDTYRGRLMKKLGTPDLPALVKFAVRHGLTHERRA